MPYQGSNYQPIGSYGGNYDGYDYRFQAGPRGSMSGGGSSHPPAQQAYHQPQQQRQQYQAPLGHSGAAYATPQFYEQGQQSFYPSPSLPYQSQGQQPYLSPLLQSDGFPQNPTLSPDPLQYYQPPPVPQRQQVPQPQRQSQQYQQPQRPPSANQPQQRPQQRPQYSPSTAQSVRQPHQQTPRRDYPTPSQVNSAAAAQNSHLPRQSHQQQQQQRRQSSQQTPQSANARQPAQTPRPQVQNQPSRPTSQHHQPPQRPPQPSPRLPQAPDAQHRPQPVIRHPPPQIQRTPSQQRPQPQSRPSSDNIRRQQPGQPPHTTPQSVPRQNQAQAQPSPAQAPATIDPSVLQHRVLHVEIPVQRVPKSDHSTMARSPKRRRSNDGDAIAVCNAPKSKSKPASQRPKKPDPPTSSLTELASSQLPPTPSSGSIDYQAVLLGLSNEYISAAYSMSTALSEPDVSDEQLDHYQALLATGMGCLESILKNFNISDSRKEARIRLRLASLLFEETDNETLADEVLTKGIAICERARLTDLKYAMHHLLVRIWFKGNKTKAAIKAVEKHIVEAEKLNILHWLYAFRFLRITLSLQSGTTPAETSAALKQLAAITAAAERNFHVSVQLVAATYEALLHLRSRAPDSVDAAQRAIAAARTHQLSPEMAAMPQVGALLDCIDLGCSLMRFHPDQAAAKAHKMQSDMDALARQKRWSKDGSWHMATWVPPNPSAYIETDTAGVFKMLNNSVYGVNFVWVTRNQVYILGFLLSGLAGFHKNASHELQAEAFLQEGNKLSQTALDSVPQSVTVFSARNYQQRLTRIIVRLYVVFACAGRSDWEKAGRGASNIRKEIQQLETEPNAEIVSLSAYLEAVTKHGLGDLDGAMELYQSPELRLQLSMDGPPPPANVDPVKVLAALNSILILRLKGEVHAAEVLLYQLQPYCVPNLPTNSSAHGSKVLANKALESVFFVLKATGPPDQASDNPIITAKQFLQNAVQAAKDVLNNQLLSIVMNIMTDRFFTNIIGDQSEKSAKAGRSLAKKSQDKLWIAVADRMYGNTLEKCGKRGEAEQARREAQEHMARLPAAVRAVFQQDDG